MLTLLLVILAQQSNHHYPPSRERINRFRFELANATAATGGDLPHLFVVAPANGAGMGAVCAGTAITAVGGQAVTMTRSSSAYCTTGPYDAPMSMTLLTSDKPRVTYEPDLGGGRLGVYYEPTSTNTALRSQEFDSALVWVPAGTGGAAVPTVTANAGLAPDGTMTADRIQIQAVSGSQNSYLIQAGGCTGSGAVDSASIYLRGNGQSGVIYISLTGSGIVDTCTYADGVTSRCKLENVTVNGVTSFPLFGSAGSAVTAAQDFFAWGFQCEVAVKSTSYIATTSAAATRATEVYTVTAAALSTAGITNADGCFGSDSWQLSPLSRQCGVAGSGGTRSPFLTGAAQARGFDGANQNSSTGISAGLLYAQILSLAARWKTGVGINSWSTSIGDGALQSTYNDAMFGASAIQLGTTDGSCGAGTDPLWMTRMRFDTYANGCH